ncbi:hypothetical protein P8452_70811 [Trifolium repens]|nr:hypothetical protein P8452_70811 [Trifolium repens]
MASYNNDEGAPRGNKSGKRGLTRMPKIHKDKNKGIKDTVWEKIQEAYVVGIERRHFVLREAGKLHNVFRTKVRKKHLRDSDGNYNEHPPREIYPHISQEQWDSFVAWSKSEKFQKLSKDNRERALDPEYPYRISRKGYARLHVDMKKEAGGAEPPLMRVWKTAHAAKNGAIDNDNVQKNLDKCEELAQTLPDEDVEDRGHGDVSTIGQAVGTIVAWPFHLVEFVGECRKINNKLQNKDKKMQRSAESVASPTKPRKKFKNQEPPAEVGDSKKLGFLRTFVTHMWAAESLLEVKDKIILAPFNFGKVHWALLVIDPYAGIIYYLDPMATDPTRHLICKKRFENALLIYRAYNLTKPVAKSKLNRITWIRIECPQQTNTTDCGYFVMRFMKEIVMQYPKKIPDKYFDEYKCRTYSKDKLDEVKDEWAEYMFTNVIPGGSWIKEFLKP